MNNPQPIITLLTDFGTRDGFVGVMKGVMLQIAPNSVLVDISHELPPFSISAAAFLNEWAYGYFPQGTVHLSVVDPGVGTRRRVLAVETSGHLFLAPDNGLLSPLFKSGGPVKIVHVTNHKLFLDKISHTFHGRDIFSPLAAHLSKGTRIEELGPEIDDPVVLNLKPLQVNEKHIACSIRYIDRFGNLVTNLDSRSFEDWLKQTGCDSENVVVTGFGHRIQGISRAYGEKQRGDLLAIFDGFDRLEISVSAGDAASVTGLGIGDTIYVQPSKGK